MKLSILFKLTLILVLLHSTMILSAQLSLDWAFSQGGTESDLSGSCRIDDQGGMYMLTTFRDTADMNPGAGVDMVFVEDDEILGLCKFNQHGEYLWGGQFKSVGDPGGYIAEVKNNRILLIIYYTDTLIYAHDTPWMAVNPGKQVAVLSMNLDGQIISYHHLANNHELYFSNFSTQPDGSILAGGGFEDPVTFPSLDSTTTLVPIGRTDAFICRFNQLYQLEWITMFGSKGYDFMENIYPGDNGMIYYAMIHDSTIMLQTNHGQIVSATNGEDNAIYGSTKSDGTIETAYLFGGDLGDQLSNIAVDSDGNMYISGYFEGDVNFQHPSGSPVIYTSLNESDGFVAKYSADGLLLWARIFPNEDYGGVYTMRLHRNTHLYLSGTYSGRTDLDPGPDSLIVDGGVRGDGFACKLDTDGNLVWVHSIVGESFMGIRNLIPGTDGKLFIHGFYWETIDCDPGPDEHLLQAQGGSDIFVIGFTEENVVTSSSDVHPSSMVIYPNPARDYVEIKTDSPIEYVEVFNTNGTPLLHSKSNQQLMTRINTSALVPGLYILQIKTEGQYIIEKFLITE